MVSPGEYLFAFCLVAGTAAAVNPSGEAQRNVSTMGLCRTAQGSVSLLDSDVFVIANDSVACTGSTERLAAYRVTVSTNHTDDTHPLIVTVRQAGNGELVTWAIPYEPQRYEDAKFLEVSEIICPVLSTTDPSANDSQLMYIDVLTSYPTDVGYSLKVEPVLMFQVSFDQPFDLTAGPASPELRFAEIPSSHKDGTIKVSAESTEDSCVEISVQEAVCPVRMDTGMFQTMTRSATLTFKGFDVDQKFFVMVTRIQSSTCDPDKTDEDRTGIIINGTELLKNITVVVTTEDSVGQFPGLLVLPIIIFLVMAATVAPVVVLCSPKWKTFCWCETNYPLAASKSETVANFIFDKTLGELLKPCFDRCGWTKKKDKGCSILPQFCKDQDDCFISDINKRDQKYLYSKYRVYFWSVATVFVFYVLPALQVLLAVLDVLIDSGNQDLCYYNFKCAHPISLGSLGDYKAFNGLWSNILYVLLGALFVIIVWLRGKRAVTAEKETTENTQNKVPADTAENITQIEMTTQMEMPENTTRIEMGMPDIVDNNNQMQEVMTGVPQFPGIFYAMGFLLIAEGCMSAVYHICPTNRNFQFDTTFMFIIGGLALIKIFQYRHPDHNTKAHIAFLLLSFIIFLTLIGIYQDHRNPAAVRSVLFFILLLILTCFLVSFYHFHECWGVANMKKLWKDCSLCHFKDKGRLLKLTLAFVINLVLGITLIAAPNITFASAILYLFLATFGYFLLLYIGGKIYHCERTWKLLPAVYLFVSIVAMVSALYFFFDQTYDSELTPSESRTLNQDCALGGFYDNHDLWHFLSACGLFFLLLFMLVIDDGVVDVAQNKLHVF